MNKIFWIALCIVLFTYSCQNKTQYDTVEGDESVALPEAVSDFDYKQIEGEFKGDFEGKEAILILKDNDTYELKYAGQDYKGKYYSIDDGSVIELEFMEYQTTLPFYQLKIEEPTFLNIWEEKQPSDYYLEKK